MKTFKKYGRKKRTKMTELRFEGFIIKGRAKANKHFNDGPIREQVIL
jgi:hypothetical protein